MKKVILASMLAVCASSAFAGDHTVSIGYANDNIGDGEHLQGVIVSYDYNNDTSPIGFTSSLSLTGKDYNESNTYSDGWNEKAEVTAGKGSLLVGANYRVNDYIAPYVLVGVARGGLETKYSNDDGVKLDETNHDTGFAYGAGIRITPIENVSIRAGYEGTKLFDTQINGFNVGVGYTF